MDINLTLISLALLVVLTICLASAQKDIDKSERENKIFSEQLVWFKRKYGDEETHHLLEDIRKTNNPHKTLNEKMKNLNPELVNKEIY